MFSIFKKWFRIMVMSLKGRVRAYLGLDDVPSMAMYKALNLAMQTRHNDLTEKLERIENLLIVQPVVQSSPIPIQAVYDWDTIQAIALSAIENDSKNQKDN